MLSVLLDEHLDPAVVAFLAKRTIPDLLVRWALAGEIHAGVIFVSRLTIAQADVGQLAKPLTAFWDTHHDLDWTNRIAYLRRPRDE